MLVGVLVSGQSGWCAVEESLRLSGHDGVAARDEGEALRRFGTDSCVDVIVLTVDGSRCDGLGVCLALRRSGQQAPVLFLLVEPRAHDRMACFEVGGDDYLAHPFDDAELVARIQALGRRSRRPLSPTPHLDLDPVRHAVRTGRGEVALTPTEFRLLASITTRPEEVVPRHAVMSAAWPDSAGVSDKTLDSFVRQVRGKLAAIGSGVEIETVRGIGYRLRSQATTGP